MNGANWFVEYWWVVEDEGPRGWPRTDKRNEYLDTDEEVTELVTRLMNHGEAAIQEAKAD